MKKLLACFLSAAALVCVLSGCARTDDGVITDKPADVTTNMTPTPKPVPTVDVNVSTMPETSAAPSASAWNASAPDETGARSIFCEKTLHLGKILLENRYMVWYSI